MRKIKFEKQLDKKLRKISKKDRKKSEAIKKKVREIANSADIEHYKNLQSPLQHLKRVHIESSFVLVFKYDKSEDKVIFIDFDHHDKIYK